MTEGITGVVLAGGESRRFGSNKALASWNGRTMVEGVVGILAGIFPSNLVVLKEPGSLGFLRSPNVRVVEDMVPEAHSLGGILSALSHASTRRAFICACDMPFLRPRLIEGLCEASCGYDAAIPLWRGELQPLCGVYSKDCRGVIECLINERRLRIKDLFELVRTRFLSDDEVEALDPGGLSFVDLDTRAQYEQALQAAAR